MRSIGVMIVVAIAMLGSSNCLADDVTADGIRETSVTTLSCREIATGRDLKFEVETVGTTASFGGSSSSGPTKRTISIEFRGKRAESVITSSVPKGVKWGEVEQFFLKKSYSDQSGVEYDYAEGYSDKKRHAFPVQFLRLKAEIPVNKRIKDEYDFTLTHFALNIVLPEGRLQDEKTFMANAYLEYAIINNRGIAVDNLGGGLAQLECSRQFKKL